MSSQVFLIPCPIAEDALHSLPPGILEAIKQCKVFFVENERSARRFLKQLWKEMVIDDYQWFVIQDTDAAKRFSDIAKQGLNIGIISEAGCPGVADPGQELIALAQSLSLKINPLVGPSSILLALMASGMNGQRFTFNGYLPINEFDRGKALKQLEADALKNQTTHIFIETPYRNNALLQTMVRILDPKIRLCIAVDITGSEESIRTMPVSAWKKEELNIHKKTAIFLISY
jgi:16S rRNA (cytidine1402-2'-O)-methyltransferase